MIEILLQNPRVLHQKVNDEYGLPEPAISACNDASGLIVISQQGREILINSESLNEFIKMIRDVNRLSIEANS